MSSNSGYFAYRPTAPPAVGTAEYAQWQQWQQWQQSGLVSPGAVYVSTPGSSLASPTPYDAPTASAYGNSRSSASMTSPYAGQGQPYDRAQYGLRGEQSANGRPGYDVEGVARPYMEDMYRPRDPRDVRVSYQRGEAVRDGGGAMTRGAARPKPPKGPPPDPDFDDLAREGGQYQGDPYMGGEDYRGGVYQPPSSRPQPNRRTTTGGMSRYY